MPVGAKKGQVRNPNGRPKGSPNRSNLVLDELQKQGFNLIAAMVKVAKTDPPLHDENYLALVERQDKNRFKLLDRVCPALKAMEHTFEEGKGVTVNLNFTDPTKR